MSSRVRLLYAALILLLCAATKLEAATVTLAWDANTESNLAGYVVRYGRAPGVYTNQIDVGNRTQYAVMPLAPGTWYFTVQAYNSSSQFSPNSAEVSTTIPALPATYAPDADGDHKSDLMVWRPGNGTWYWLTSSSTYNYASAGNKQWGNASAGDVAMTGDIDGDGMSDLVVWRASSGTWYWLTSASGFNYANAGNKQWGNQALGDVPILGDIDGDGKADLIVWRASTGTWFWLNSSTNYVTGDSKQWGNQALGDVPIRADIDGDGRSDLVIWRASTGTWYWLTSSSGYASGNSKQWGNQALGDVPLVGDLDGDGKADLTIWRASTGTWYWLNSSSGYVYGGGQQWGSLAAGDVPFLTDLDGDGKADPTVWRASTGTWYWLTSSSGYSYSLAGSKQWGSSAQGDVPIVK